ncbi:MAG: InlB B-repeat-containing protein [Oscillospiraceae bacterium]
MQGESYKLPSPQISGYVADTTVVQGTVQNADVAVTVYYQKAQVAAANAPAPQAEEEKQPQLLTVNYFYLEDGTNPLGGSVAAESFYGQFLQDETYSVPSPAVAGYLPSQAAVSGTMGGTNVVVDVWYSPAGQTAYTVQHLFEDLSGNYVADASYPQQTLHGATGETTSASAYTVAGFAAQNITQSAIAADGSTTIVVRYTRQENYVYFKTDGKAYVEPIALKYEQTATLPANPTADGYVFEGWYTDANKTQPYVGTQVTMGAQDITLFAKWTAQNAMFKAAIWIESASDFGTYEYSRVITHPSLTQGEVGSMSQLQTEDMPAYTGLEILRVDNKIIQADGSTLVNVYYDRQICELKFYRGFKYNDWDPNEWINSIETEPYKIIRAKYGSDIRSEWYAMGEEFFNYRWMSQKTNQWGNWTTGLNNMLTSRDYYGVPNPNNFTYSIHYYIEMLDQTSEEYGKIYNGIKYEEDLDQLVVFKNKNTDVNLLDSNVNTILGFTYKSGNFQNFVQDGSTGEYHGYYYYSRNTSVVEFNTLGGSAAPASFSGRYQDDISANAPADPTREGYHFAGWFKNEYGEGDAFVFDIIPAANTMLYAKWVKNQHTVSFDVNYAGVDEAPNAQRVDHGDVAQEPGRPQREGYAFKGWYADAAGTGSRYVFDKPVADSFTLYAVWSNESTTYTVKYTKADGGEYAPSVIKNGLAGQTVTETAAIDDGQKYVPDVATKSISLVELPENNVVEFVYQPFTTLSYKIEYRYASDGELIPDAILGQSNGKIVSDSELARVVEAYLPVSGYTPDVYQKTKVLSYEVTPQDIQQNVIVFYYNINNGVDYTVEHYLQNPAATGADDKYFATPETTETLTAALGSTVKGQAKSFVGYAHNAATGNTQGVVANSPKLVIKMYYDIQSYTVKFDSQGGTQVASIPNIKAGTVLAGQQPANPTRTGFTFVGWYKESAGTNAWNFNSDVVNSDITLYAVWHQDSTPQTSYVVTYNNNGGTGSQSDTNAYTAGAVATIKDSGTVQRTGYTFAGWSFNGTVYQPGNTLAINQNITFMAVWRENGSSSSTPPTSSESSTPSESGSDSSSGGTGGIVTPSQSSSSAGAGANGPSGGFPSLSDIPYGSLTEAGAWSLLNLIITITAVAVSLALVMSLFKKEARRLTSDYDVEYDEAAGKSKKPFRIFAILGAAVGAALLMLFLLLENLTLSMAWVNRWTVLVLLVFVVQMLIVIAGRAYTSYKKRKDNQEEDEKQTFKRVKTF